MVISLKFVLKILITWDLGFRTILELHLQVLEFIDNILLNLTFLRTRWSWVMTPHNVYFTYFHIHFLLLLAPAGCCNLVRPYFYPYGIHQSKPKVRMKTRNKKIHEVVSSTSSKNFKCVCMYCIPQNKVIKTC